MGSVPIAILCLSQIDQHFSIVPKIQWKIGTSQVTRGLASGLVSANPGLGIIHKTTHVRKPRK